MVKKKTPKLEVEPILDAKETVRQHKKIEGRRTWTGGKRAEKSKNFLREVRKVDALGRQTGKVSLTRELNRYLLDNTHIIPKIIKAWIKECEGGNIQALQEMINRIDGKVAEIHKIDAENPVTLIFAPALLTTRPEQEYAPIINIVEGADSTKQDSVEPDEVRVRELPLPS